MNGNDPPKPTHAGEAHDREVLAMAVNNTEMQARFGFGEGEESSTQALLEYC